MKDNITLNQWVKNFDAGLYDSKNCDVQCSAGWYDWFCRDTSLRNRLYKMAPKVKQIAASTKIDTEKTYIFFKNNCPMYGSLYDDFRICDLETGDVDYTITPRTGHKFEPGKHAHVWSKENGFQCPIVEGTWSDVRKFFGV